MPYRFPPPSELFLFNCVIIYIPWADIGLDFDFIRDSTNEKWSDYIVPVLRFGATFCRNVRTIEIVATIRDRAFGCSAFAQLGCFVKQTKLF